MPAGSAPALLLARAVSLQRCPLASIYLRPRSPAQLSSRGPAQGGSASAPLGSLQGSLGLQGNTMGNSLKQALMFPPSAGRHTAFLQCHFSEEKHSLV